MKSSHPSTLPHARWLLAGGIALAGLFAGCATTGARIQARIDEKPEVFAKLTKQQQKDIKWGYVRHGFTPDMVYFAYGKPDQIIASADKDSYVWVFVDRSAINEDLATASALRSASKGDAIRTHNPDGTTSTVWSGHTDNFPTHGATVDDPSQLFDAKDLQSADIYSTVDPNAKQPTIWVAFKDGLVVNVQRFGDHHNQVDRSGSLGG